MAWIIAVVTVGIGVALVPFGERSQRACRSPRPRSSRSGCSSATCPKVSCRHDARARSRCAGPGAPGGAHQATQRGRDARLDHRDAPTRRAHSPRTECTASPSGRHSATSISRHPTHRASTGPTRAFEALALVLARCTAANVGECRQRGGSGAVGAFDEAVADVDELSLPWVIIYRIARWMMWKNPVTFTPCRESAPDHSTRASAASPACLALLGTAHLMRGRGPLEPPLRPRVRRQLPHVR